MVIFKRFIIMVQFFTSIPVPVNIECSEKDYGKGLVFAPLVGLILGIFMCFVYKLLSLFLPANIISVLLVIVYIALTGGLHLDGLGDTFDGLYSNRPKEKILEIMRDSRVGTNAVLALVSIILLNYVLLTELNTNPHIIEALLLFPVAGRIGSLMGAGVSVYARKNEGLGKSFIDHCGKKEMFFGGILSIVIFSAIYGVKGLIMAAIVMITAVIITKIFTKKIEGATGDILGAVCELNQTTFLVLFYIMEVVLKI
ncbi:adenosylcobinamide-GDP ribazoletransferase [Acetivibrio cellulolyticus]|uniref:adenosylcobinamide-GDP ribazoletransferase n=1 Tax=Acetivibrio cellulolyticus TaxID=35830 RepID=UPI0001E2DEF6|nr:adenosylcobinamide-GDP ribazoletransferase [Acetivibrio cellulolyticus]